MNFLWKEGILNTFKRLHIPTPHRSPRGTAASPARSTSARRLRRRHEHRRVRRGALRARARFSGRVHAEGALLLRSRHDVTVEGAARPNLPYRLLVQRLLQRTPFRFAFLLDDLVELE